MKIRISIWLNYLRSYSWLTTALAGVILLNIILVFGVRSSHKDFVQKNEELSLMAAKKAGLIQISRDESKIVPVYEKINSRFVHPDKLVDFIEFMENAARAAGGSAKVDSVLGSGNADKMFKLSFTGSYTDFINFLAQLENSNYLLKVLKTDVSGSVDPETQNSVLRVNINVAVAVL